MIIFKFVPIESKNVVKLIFETNIWGDSRCDDLIMIFVEVDARLHKRGIRLCISWIMLACKSASPMMNYNFSLLVYIWINHHSCSIWWNVLMNLHVFFTFFSCLIFSTVSEERRILALLLLPCFSYVLSSKIWISFSILNNRRRFLESHVFSWR